MLKKKNNQSLIYLANLGVEDLVSEFLILSFVCPRSTNFIFLVSCSWMSEFTHYNIHVLRLKMLITVDWLMDENEMLWSFSRIST